MLQQFNDNPVIETVSSMLYSWFNKNFKLYSRYLGAEINCCMSYKRLMMCCVVVKMIKMLQHFNNKTKTEHSYSNDAILMPLF